MPLRVYCRSKDGDFLNKNVNLHNEGIKITYNQYKKKIILLLIKFGILLIIMTKYLTIYIQIVIIIT